MTKKDEKHLKEEEETKEPDETIAKAEFDALKDLAGQLEGNYKRALADYQNLQKRVSDERRILILNANKDLLLRILSILDTLILANKHDSSEGLKVAIKQFEDVLKSEGVTKIETVGQDFNPETMEAIAIEEGEEGKIIEEVRSGFLLNDKLLRVAQVKVGKAMSS